MSTVNTKNGIRFGVLSGNNIPDTLELIQENGRNLTYEAMIKELQNKIRDAVAGAIGDYHHNPERLAKRLDYEAMTDALGEAGLWDNQNAQEEEYLWETQTSEGPMTLSIMWLGGAPLIVVNESPWVIGCRSCSPCVPNAGDLDNLSPDGADAYCLPPDLLPEDWQGEQPRLRQGAGVVDPKTAMVTR